MCKVKSILIVLFITNHFNHATTENYEEQFPDEKEKESINNFIAWETKSFLEKLNEKRKKDKKEAITIEQIRNDLEVTEENEILIDILNNFSTTLQNQNENRRNEIEYIEIDKKKYCNKITIEAKKGIMFASDTHADAKMVEKIFYFFDQLKHKNEVDKLVFLGDYGDRGGFWTYTYFLLAAMAEKYGEDILFIRGNHEDSLIMLTQGGGVVYDAINKKNTQNLWNEMPLIYDITWNQKKIFCSHGAMPINQNGEWLTYEKTNELSQEPIFLANWNENIFTEDPKQGIKTSKRGSGYEIPIKKIFENMINKEYDWSIHGHVHEKQCGILKNKNKRVVTVVTNEYYYNNYKLFLPAVYIINNENKNGTFFNLLQKQNERIKGYYKEYPTNGKVLNNCVIYEYDFGLQKTNEKINEFDKENQTNKKEQKEEIINQENQTNEEEQNNKIINQDNINEEKKIDCNILKKIYCCCDICEK